MQKLLLLLLLFVVSCKNLETERDYPVDTKEKNRNKYGSLTSGKGISLLEIGGKKKDEFNVNSALWQASLDVLGFMPLTQADKQSGVIITDWYEDADSKGEKFKINAIVSPGELSANSIKITMFKQARDKKGNWKSVAVSEKLITSFEDKILARARELRVRAGGE